MPGITPEEKAGFQASLDRLNRRDAEIEAEMKKAIEAIKDILDLMFAALFPEEE